MDDFIDTLLPVLVIIFVVLFLVFIISFGTYKYQVETAEANIIKVFVNNTFHIRIEKYLLLYHL